MSATCSLVDGNVFQIRAVVLDSYCKGASVFTIADTLIATGDYAIFVCVKFKCKYKILFLNFYTGEKFLLLVLRSKWLCPY